MVKPVSLDPTPNIGSTVPIDIFNEITSLLYQFQDVFQTPSGLPPTRPHDHHIPTNPSVAPVNIFQKSEI